MSNVLKYARFVATKYSSNAEGWTYSRDRGDLAHIRYRSDHTGYNHWTKRAWRTLNPRSMFGDDHLLGRAVVVNQGWGYFWASLRAHVSVGLRKDRNLPDGTVNGGGIITFWEEDGEYITLFGPTVGVKVLDFIEAEPTHPHAQAIRAEIERVSEMSWPTTKAAVNRSDG